MDTLTRLAGLSDEHKAVIWSKWPDDIERPRKGYPAPDWPPQHRKRIDDFLDRLTGFNAEADPAVMEQARANVRAAMKRAEVTGNDDDTRARLAAIVAFADADRSTAEGLELLARTFDRVASGELVAHIAEHGDGWTVTEAGEGSDLAHRRAVTDASRHTGEWVAVVTIQHAAGHLYVGGPHTITGRAAKAIADIINKEKQGT